MKYKDRDCGRWECEAARKPEANLQFVVGDRVKVVGDNEYCRGFSRGEFTIVEIHPKAAFWNVVEFLGGVAFFTDDELELVTRRDDVPTV